jgi:hypothetical protein
LERSQNQISIGSSYYFKNFKEQTIVMKELTKKTNRTLENSLTFSNFNNHGYYIKIGYLRNIENHKKMGIYPIDNCWVFIPPFENC